MKMKRVIGLSIIVTAADWFTVLALRASERNAMTSPQRMREQMDMMEKMEMVDKMEVADVREKMDMMEKMEMADKMEVADLLDAAKSYASNNNFSGANEKVANARGLVVDNTDRSKIASTEAYIEGERSRYNEEVRTAAQKKKEEEVRIAAQKKKEEDALLAAAIQKESQRRAQTASSGYSGGYYSNYNASSYNANKSRDDLYKRQAQAGRQQMESFAREARQSSQQSSLQSTQTFRSDMNRTFDRMTNNYGRR